MTQDGDDLLDFLDDAPGATPAPRNGRPPWKVLVVDDDPDVHESTAFALRGLEIEGRALHLLHASSGTGCIATLRSEEDVAVVLLDVVMERSDAGLITVGRIRDELGLHHTRIILRTGQPGQAPEIDTIRRYDINDYKTKSELTRHKLFTTLTTAIRSYAQLCRLEESRRGLEQIVVASHDLMARDGLAGFAAGVITQIAGLLGIPSEGLVCASLTDPAADISPEHLLIIAAAGCFSHLVQHPVSEIQDPEIVANLTQALREQRNLVTQRSVTLCFNGREGSRFAAFVDSPEPLGEVDRRLLEVFCTNISLCADNVELVARLRDTAFVDALLGLPNRSALIQRLDDLIHGGCIADHTLVLIDVDQFAETNDMFGNVYGDRLLAAICDRLRSALPADCLIARIASDTFAVLGRAALVDGAALCPLFEHPFDVEGIERLVSVSMGFARGEGRSRHGMEVLNNASIALKRAKALGQGAQQWYSHDIGEESRAHIRLLHGLHQAFERNQLFLAFQPQVSLESGRAVGVEALLRWRREDGSFVPPDQFIPVAERSGLIVALGTWVLQTALAARARLAEAGHGDVRMAINVSPVQLRDPAYLEALDALMARSPIAPGRLEFEITESVALMGISRVSGLLAGIKARGIELAIDDFGTGFSSLSYLDKLPVDRLKIDRSFVGQLDSADSGGRIAEMIVPLGQCLGMGVVAEGVETPEQAERLRALGCKEVQGYLYARPMPLDELLGWLQTRREMHA
ncbi:MAG: hypothetical protein PWP11_1868 [Thauera sp.]|nr:EAL domain-containing protein [Thauera sp.]MDI3490591.1 hypothetical protein [Thauera sp.]